MPSLVDERTGHVDAAARSPLAAVKDARIFVRPGLIALLAALAASFVLLAANVLSAALPRAQIEASIRQGFNQKQLVRYGWLPLNPDIGVHQFNDCLVLLMAVDDRAPVLKRALSPTISGASVGTGGAGYTIPCPVLRKFVSEKRAPLLPTDHYHRYVHGNVALTAAMLQFFSIKGARTIYAILALIAPLSVMWFAARRLLRPETNGGDAGPATLSFAFLFAGMIALFFGAQYYDQSFAHFPADILLSLYLLGVVLFGARLERPGRFAACNAVFGALTMYFEFLSGGTPMGVSLVLAIASAQALDRGGDLKRICFAGACFALGVVTIYAVKQTATAVVFGSEVITAAGTRLESWMDGANPWQTTTQLFWQLRELAGGSQTGGVLLELAAFAALFASLFRLGAKDFQAPPGAKAGYWGLVLAALVAPVWWMVFRLHSYVHAWMMVRIIIGFNAAAFFLFAALHREQIARGVERLAQRWRG